MNFPAYRKGQRITAQTTSAVTSLASQGVDTAAAPDVLVWNPGPYPVHLLVGDADLVADNACPPVPPGAMWAFNKSYFRSMATIAIGGPQDIVVFVGQGD